MTQLGDVVTWSVNEVVVTAVAYTWMLSNTSTAEFLTYAYHPTKLSRTRGGTVYTPKYYTVA